MREFTRSNPSEVIATCVFYRTNWYECYGVADCSRGEGMTRCKGGEPWRGSYRGTPDQGQLLSGSFNYYQIFFRITSDTEHHHHPFFKFKLFFSRILREHNICINQ
jgi:hypothetical protein